jgi:hypothetical protein
MAPVCELAEGVRGLPKSMPVGPAGGEEPPIAPDTSPGPRTGVLVREKAPTIPHLRAFLAGSVQARLDKWSAVLMTVKTTRAC